MTKHKENMSESNQEELITQLRSPNLMRLWITGASEFLYSTEEDDYFDVSVHMFDVFFYYKCIIFLSARISGFARQ